MKNLFLFLMFLSPCVLFADSGDITVINTISPKNSAFQYIVRSTNVFVSTTPFSKNLGPTDTNLQHALVTLDQLTTSGGSASLSGPDTGLLSKNGSTAISSATLTYNTTSNLLTIGATTQFSSVSTTSWTNVSTMTFGNGSALVMSTSTNLQLPSGQILTNGSSVTVQGVLTAGSNITLTPTAGILTIAASGSSGGGYNLEPATVTIQSAKGEKASTMTITGLSPGVMHIVATSSNVVTTLVSLSTEVTGTLPLANMVSSVTVAGALVAGTNITLSPGVGVTTITASGSGGSSIYSATSTASFPFGFSASTAVFTGQYVSIEATTTFSAQTSTVNWNTGNVQYLVLTATTAIAFTNPQPGGRYALILRQDTTGSRTVTWPASVHFSSGATPTLTTTASKEDVITFLYDGNNSFYLAGYTLNY